MNKNYHNPFTIKDYKEIKQQIKEYNENYDLIQERSDKILEAWNKDMATNFNDYLNEQLKDECFRTEYDALEPEYALIRAIIDARKSKGITQKTLSEKTGIAQGDISKLENGNSNPSLRTLCRLAAGMDMKLKIEFVPK